ncbi:MAG: PepSY domain-containing protein, partial [Actinomycetota bacterium]|nr:PepSY domain-containing protein [Actinomycetota bacterium]
VLAGGGQDDADTPITGSALEQASAAALDHVGEGQVSGTEVGDEEGYYEVEVTLDDGSAVDVHLDADFTVRGTEAETAEAETADDE